MLWRIKFKDNMESPFFIFTWLLPGFRNQPTDHYFRYFCVAAEPNYNKFLPDCLGSRPRHSVLLDYMNEVFAMYPDRRKWMFSFQSQLSHKDNNLLSKVGGLSHCKLVAFYLIVYLWVFTSLKICGCLPHCKLVGFLPHWKLMAIFLTVVLAGSPSETFVLNQCSLEGFCLTVGLCTFVSL